MPRHKRGSHEQEQTPVGPAAVSQASTQAPEVTRKRKNIIGTAMPYLAPEQAAWTGTVLGYRPKKRPSRPLVQPNPV